MNAIINMLQIILDREQAACLKPETFYWFIQEMFRVRANNTPYILTVLRYPGFLKYVCFFISTRYR